MGDKTDETEAAKIFSVPDFVGDACKAIASRVRGAVAGVKFDDFHKVSCRSYFFQLTQLSIIWGSQSTFRLNVSLLAFSELREDHQGFSVRY